MASTRLAASIGAFPPWSFTRTLALRKMSRSGIEAEGKDAERFDHRAYKESRWERKREEFRESGKEISEGRERGRKRSRQRKRPKGPKPPDVT